MNIIKLPLNGLWLLDEQPGEHSWYMTKESGVRFVAGIRYFSVPESVGISCGTHPTSHPVRTMGHISLDKAAGA